MSQEARRPPGGAPRVLLVDPNRVFLRTLERTLHPDKYEIGTVQTVLDAIAELSRTEYDLVISEVQFPGLTGFDLVRRLREDPKRAHIAVVLITGNPNTTDAERARQLGVLDMLTKPVRPQLVRQRIRKVIDTLELSSGSDASGSVSGATGVADGSSETGSANPNAAKPGLAIRKKQDEPAKRATRFAQRAAPVAGASIAKILHSSVRQKRRAAKASPLADPRMAEVRVPVFRNTTHQILQLLSSPETTVRQVSRIVETDPGLSLSVLKVVNSAYYGLKSEVGSVPDACALLGLRDLGSICLGASVSEVLLKRDDAISRACWSQSLASGYAAREIGQLVGLPRNTDPGVAGILSGVGILATVASPGIDHEEIADYVDRKQCRWAEAEREILGFDHAELGGAIARQWGMPPWIGRVIEDCEDPANVGRPDEWVVAVAGFAAQWQRPECFPRHPDPVAALHELAKIRPTLWSKVSSKLEAIALAAWEQPDPAGVMTDYTPST